MVGAEAYSKASKALSQVAASIGMSRTPRAGLANMAQGAHQTIYEVIAGGGGEAARAAAPQRMLNTVKRLSLVSTHT